MSKETDQVYHSFLVRCWLVPRETTDEPALWRFELREVPAEAQKQRFSNLEGLKAYMEAKLAAIVVISKRDNGKKE